MKIRLKITLWMIGTGCLSIFIFLLFLLHEAQEAQYESIQRELEWRTQYLSQIWPWLKPNLNQTATPFSDWLVIQTPEGTELFRSPLAQKKPLLLPENEKKMNIQNNFAIWRYTFLSGERIFLALDIRSLSEERQELFHMLWAGLAFALLVLGGSSYWVAAKILKPVQVINQLADDIGARHLERRIPLPVSRDELYDLTHSLNKMFERLEHASKQWQQFLSDASHELKTPLALLRLYLEQLQHLPALPENFQNRLDGQIQAVLRMERLIRQLLELSVMEAKTEMQMETLDLSQLLLTLCDDLAALVESKELQFEREIAPSLTLKGQRESLRQMLIALLENAINHNQAGGKVAIKLRKMENQIYLQVANTGPEIPQEEQQAIFRRFYRLDKARSGGGSGLGLAIVQQICRLHQGQIAVNSAAGWNFFEVVFPCR